MDDFKLVTAYATLHECLYDGLEQLKFAALEFGRQFKERLRELNKMLIHTDVLEAPFQSLQKGYEYCFKYFKKLQKIMDGITCPNRKERKKRKKERKKERKEREKKKGVGWGRTVHGSSRFLFLESLAVATVEAMMELANNWAKAVPVRRAVTHNPLWLTRVIKKTERKKERKKTGKGGKERKERKEE